MAQILCGRANGAEADDGKQPALISAAMPNNARTGLLRITSNQAWPDIIYIYYLTIIYGYYPGE